MRSRILSTQRASERERKKNTTHTVLRGVGVEDLHVKEEGGGGEKRKRMQVERKEGDERKVDGRQEVGKRKGRERTLVFLLSPPPVSVDRSAWCHRCLGPAEILSAASPAAPSSGRFPSLFFAERENLPKNTWWINISWFIYLFLYIFTVSCSLI